MENIFSIARRTKDKNFDGKFFFGVKTTGIFCRPSCPSPTAKEENVIYFDTIFEALEYGLRPCLRCKPDINAEYYTGNFDGMFVVNLALEMIYNGYLNDHSIRELSKELLISDRHLRKLFIDHLGVPPVKIATYHKALFAKKLLIFSDRSITDIAFASGFGSIRQFNDVFKEIFGASPTMVRKELREDNNRQNKTTLLLKYKPPFDFKQVLSFLKPRELRGVEVITGNSYSRTFRTRNTKGFFTVTDNPEQSALELQIGCDDIKCYMEVYNRVRKMFDLDTAFTVINEKFANDPRLSGGFINGSVPRLPVAFNPFEFAIRAVLGQQISIKAATTLAVRIAEKASIQSNDGFPDGLDYFFPNPSELLTVELDNIGLTKTRQATIIAVTQAILDGQVQLTPNQPFESFHKDFSALKGIGDWTVNYVAMRGLGMVDSFPASDLGIIKAMTIEGETPPTRKELLQFSEQWRPYRAYATLCLWNQ